MSGARYVLTDLHGGQSLPHVLSGALRPGLSLSAPLQREKDTDAAETVDALLERVPGVLAAHVRVPRLLVDLNRALRGPRVLLQALPRHVPVWDFHAYDVTGPGGEERPPVQLFSSFEGAGMVPAARCRRVQRLLSILREPIRPARALSSVVAAAG